MSRIAALTLIVTLMAVAISGCVVAWGKPYKVEFESSSSITINYDPSLTNMGEVQKVAQAHCDQYGKDAIPQVSSDSFWALRNTSYICQNRQ